MTQWLGEKQWLGEWRFGTTPAEALVLAPASLLVAVVFMEAAKGALTTRAGMSLWALAALSSAAALAHMFAR